MANGHRKKGKLFVISGPSGVGKGTIIARILEDRNMDFSVSMTTREPREGEENGREYFFVTDEEFVKNIENGNFLEHAEVHGHRYGTPRDYVEKRLDRGRDMLLDIDVQGGLQVKASMPEAVMIFILPPSLAELRSRIEGRNTESVEVIEGRLRAAENEIKFIGEYDYYIVNDDIETAINNLATIVEAERLRVPERIKDIIRPYEIEAGEK